MTDPVAPIAALPVADQAATAGAPAMPGAGWMAVLTSAQDLAGAPSSTAAAPGGEVVPTAAGRPDAAAAAVVVSMPTQVPGAGPQVTLASPAAAAGTPGGAGSVPQTDAALAVPPAGLAAAMPATAAPVGRLDGNAMQGWGEPARFASLPLNVAAALSQSGYAARDAGHPATPAPVGSQGQLAPGSAAAQASQGNAAPAIPAGAGPLAQASAAGMGQAAPGTAATTNSDASGNLPGDAGQPVPTPGGVPSPVGQAAGQPSLASAGQPPWDSAAAGGPVGRDAGSSAIPSQFAQAQPGAGQQLGLDRPASPNQPAPAGPSSAAPGLQDQAGPQALSAGRDQLGAAATGQAAQGAAPSAAPNQSAPAAPAAGQAMGPDILANPGQPTSLGMAQQPSPGHASLQAVAAGPGQPAEPAAPDVRQSAQTAGSVAPLGTSGSPAHDAGQPAPGPGAAPPSLAHADAQAHLAGAALPARDGAAEGGQAVRDSGVNTTLPPLDLLGAAVAAWGAVGMAEQPLVRARKHRRGQAQGGEVWDGEAHGGDASDARLASYAEPRLVSFDLSPAPVAAACWRTDDTTVQVPAGPDGAVRAARLYGALMDGGGLDLLRPGERVRSWEGSPFLLHLAGIAKPASLGALPSSATPARIEVARHEAGWTVTHAGGGWPAPQRTALPRGAEDTDALLHAALWGAGLDEPAHPFAAAARHRFDAARLRCAPESGEPAALRRAEAWAVAARGWALALARAEHLPQALPPLPDDAAGQASTLRAVAQRHGSAYAVWLLRERGLSVERLMQGPPGPGRNELADALAPGLALDAAGEGGGTAAGPGRAGFVASGGRGLAEYGRAVLARVSVGDLEPLGLAEGLALAAHLGRLHPAGQGRLGHAPAFPDLMQAAVRGLDSRGSRERLG